MIVERTKDIGLVKSIITQPKIWESIKGSYTGTIEDISPPVDDYIYIVGTEDGDAVGLFIVHPTTFDIWQCHVQVMPKYRDSHAVDFGKRVLNWVWSNTDINKLMALIPVIYPNVKEFSELQGFCQEGLLTNSYEKGGEIHSQWLVSINRGP